MFEAIAEMVRVSPFAVIVSPILKVFKNCVPEPVTVVPEEVVVIVPMPVVF